MSDENLLSTLISDNFDYVEIGEFKDMEVFLSFIQMVKESGKKFGIHSPILRNTAKYDLLQKNLLSPEEAFTQLDSEAELLKKLNAQYLLVHFPYYSNEIPLNFEHEVEKALVKLSEISKKHDIEIIAEPKLGLSRSPYSIEMLRTLNPDMFLKYGIRLCVDIGDFTMVFKESTINIIKRWSEALKAVHIHDIFFKADEYYWIPVNPSADYELSGYVNDSIKYIVKNIKQDIILVFEHTPHIDFSKEYFAEGYNWIKTLEN